MRKTVLPTAAVAVAGVVVLVAQAAHLGELMDRERALTAGHAGWLVAGFAVAAAAIAVACIALPERLLWLPPAAAGGAAGAVLLATLTLGGEAWSFAVAALTLAACWRVGAWLLGALRAPALAALPPAAWLAGAGVVGVVLTLVGRAGAVRWWTVGAPLLALGLLALPRALPPLRAGLARARRPDRLEAAAAALTALLAGVAAVYAAAPELSYDALFSKAWLPSEWARTGRIEPSAELPQLNVMGFAQLLALPGHLVGAEGVGRYLQLLAYPAAVASVWWIARASAWAPLAAGVVAITPHLVWQATAAYDDLLLLLAAVALAGAVAAAARPGAPEGLGTAVALGLMAGACVSLKLHLAVLAAGLVGGWLVLRPGGGRLRAALAAGAGAAAVAGPPLLVRWIALGNPVLPAYNDVFHSDRWPHVNERFGFPEGDPGPLGPLEVAAESLAGSDEFGAGMPIGAFGPLVAAIVVALLVAWIGGRRERAPLALLPAVLLAAAAWYVQFRYLRFIVPVAGVALLALALSAPRGPPRRRARGVAIAALCIAAALLFPSAIAHLWYVPEHEVPLAAALGREDDLEYERRQGPERDALARFDRLAPPDATALGNLHQRLWLSEGRKLITPFETAGRLAAPAAAPHGRPLLERLRALGIEWTIARVDGRLTGRTGPHPRPPLEDLLARHGAVAWADSLLVIHRLTERPPPPRPLARLARGDLRAGPAGLEHEVPVCPGRTLVAEVRISGTGAVAVAIDYAAPDPRQGHQRAELPAGTTRSVPATAPQGSSGMARITLTETGGAKVEDLQLGTLGNCG